MSFKWPNKDPDETLDYSMDWSRFLGYDHVNSSGTTINSNKWFIDDAEGVKTELASGSDTTVNSLTSGGSVGSGNVFITQLNGLIKELPNMLNIY